MEKFMDIDSDKSGIITVDDFIAYAINARERPSEIEKENFLCNVIYDILYDLNPNHWHA